MPARRYRTDPSDSSGAPRPAAVSSRPGGPASPIALSDTAPIRLEISGLKLYQLLESGHLCAAEIRGLDRASKQRIWRYCLRACSRCLHRLCVPDPSDA